MRALHVHVSLTCHYQAAVLCTGPAPTAISAHPFSLHEHTILMLAYKGQTLLLSYSCYVLQLTTNSCQLRMLKWLVLSFILAEVAMQILQ